MGVFTKRALQFGVHIGASNLWKLPYRFLRGLLGFTRGGKEVLKGLDLKSYSAGEYGAECLRQEDLFEGDLSGCKCFYVLRLLYSVVKNSDFGSS